MSSIIATGHAAAVTALAEAGIPADVQELLVAGDPARGIPPGALAKALNAAKPRTVEVKPLVWEDSDMFSEGEGPTYSEAVGAGYTYVAEAVGCTLDEAKAEREKVYVGNVLSCLVGVKAGSQ